MMSGVLCAANVLLAVCFSCLLGTCAAIDSDMYFYFSEESRRCFVEELPQDTILIGAYKSPEHTKKASMIKVYDPENKQVFKEPAELNGRFAYQTQQAGEYTVCVEADHEKKGWPSRGGSAKFHLKLEVHGRETETIVGDNAKTHQLTSLEKELESLDSRIDLILRDLEYSKKQEVHFRNQSERINSRIMWWSLLQTLLLLLSGVWQIVHLKNFFRAKKLV
mmetsp:Transcript_14098/g.25023  ORF Transcript_14098/g.25023 Transcript_14098/m.25023 type:complete len:221 (-) Transcript_14098:2823-3485(-)